MSKDLMEWRPFREVSRLRREMDHLWDDYFGSGRRGLQPLQGGILPRGGRHGDRRGGRGEGRSSRDGCQGNQYLGHG